MKLRITCLSALLVITACTKNVRNDADVPPAHTNASWAEKMQQLSKNLAILLPLVSNQAKFDDPKNNDTIVETTKNLRALSHSLESTDKPNFDPSMDVVSGLLEADIARALESLNGGHRNYARQILRDTTSYCIQCHTQTDNGPDFPHLNLALDTKALSKLEEAEVYASTRQFERALTAYREVLTGPDLIGKDPLEWESVARAALAIAVRVKKDPKEGLEVVDAIQKNPGLPQPMKSPLTSWQASLNEWRREKPLDRTAVPAARLLKDAQTLISRAEKRQEFPLDHTQDVLYFRSQSLLHDLLSRDPKTDGLEGDERGKVLLLAGRAAEATRDMNFWTLHENYYEQCVRLRPGSAIAKQCFGRLKDSIVLGYSGSAGTNIPPEEAARLKKLEEMANSKK